MCRKEAGLCDGGQQWIPASKPQRPFGPTELPEIANSTSEHPDIVNFRLLYIFCYDEIPLYRV